jgi:hypothetical protein
MNTINDTLTHSQYHRLDTMNNDSIGPNVFELCRESIELFHRLTSDSIDDMTDRSFSYQQSIYNELSDHKTIGWLFLDYLSMKTELVLSRRPPIGDNK